MAVRARDVLAKIRAAGVRVRIDGDELIAEPGDRVTAEVVELLDLHGDALIRELLDPDQRVTCATCRNARGDWCGARGNGLPSAYIGGIQRTPQHCPAWRPSAAKRPGALADDAAESARSCEETA